MRILTQLFKKNIFGHMNYVKLFFSGSLVMSKDAADWWLASLSFVCLL